MEAESTAAQQVSNRIESSTAQPSKKLAVFALVGLFAVFVASALFNPPAGEYFTICGFKNFTGLPCPGCGLTHSFCALAKGDFTNSFAFNLLGPPLFLGLVLLWIRSAFVLSNRSSVVAGFDRMAERFNLVRAFAIAFVVYGTARIVYLLAYHPLAYNDSPLSRLIARLIH
ncbi:MAG: DUF2752 domain-containing protein [Blastocatellia bacterium]